MRHRYDQHDDDFDEIIRPPHDDASNHAGLFGAIASGVGLGLLGVIVALWFIVANDNTPVGTIRLLVWWMLFLDFAGFFAGLTGIVLGARALTPTNYLYRGWGLAGLIVGILLLLATLGGGVVLCCTGLIFELAANAPGG